MLASALALGSAIYGGVTSAINNNKARRLIQQQRDENKRWYDVKNAEDYTQRADVQAAIQRQRELLNEQYKRARATSVVGGGTDEAVALQKEAANRATSQTMTDVAAQSSAYKQGVENQYRAQDAALNQQQAQSYQQQAAATAQAASQAVNAGINLAGIEAATKSPKGVASSTPLSSPVNSDLTALGNSQLGITKDGLPAPADVSGPVRKLNA